MRRARAGDPKGKVVRADRLSFGLAHESPAHVDGEIAYDRRFHVGILPRAPSVLCDPAGALAFVTGSAPLAPR